MTALLLALFSCGRASYKCSDPGTVCAQESEISLDTADSTQGPIPFHTGSGSQIISNLSEELLAQGYADCQLSFELRPTESNVDFSIFDIYGSMEHHNTQASPSCLFGDSLNGAISHFGVNLHTEAIFSYSEEIQQWENVAEIGTVVEIDLESRFIQLSVDAELTGFHLEQLLVLHF